MATNFPKIFRWGDIFVSILLLTGVFMSLPLLIANKPENVEIYRDNKKIAEYPLFQNRDFSIKGAIGSIVIRIKDNSVSIVNSNCPHHICVKSGSIRFPNAQIVCAPNHILITIKSFKNEAIPDGIAR